jgi:hypothetical protein
MDEPPWRNRHLAGVKFQEMKMDRTKSNRPAATFNPKSTTYHAELHKAGFISDAQLAAVKSENRSNADAADAEALKKGVADSLSSIKTFTAEHPLTPKQSKAIHSRELVSTEELHNGQRAKDKLLKQNYLAKGYVFKDSKVRDHNCLITSILQHAKKDYGTNHQVLAQEYRDRLNTHLQQGMTSAQKEKFLKNDLLDAHHTDWLLKEMAKDPGFKNHNLTVELWVADDKGEPVPFTFGGGKTKVIIFNSTDHFEAVIPPSSSATTAGPTTAKRKSAPVGRPEKQSQNADKSLEFFYKTPNPLINMIDTE